MGCKEMFDDYTTTMFARTMLRKLRICNIVRLPMVDYRPCRPCNNESKQKRLRRFIKRQASNASHACNLRMAIQAKTM